MNYSFYDVYPGGGLTTRDETQPDAVDQNTMMDSEAAAQTVARVDPGTNKSIWVAITICLVIFFALGMT